MNIEKIDTSRIIISLCAGDMEKYDITFESLNFSETHSKTVLKEIMACASEKTGVNFNNKRIMIEALKYEKGCLLLVTLSARKKIYRVKYYDNSYIFTFNPLRIAVSLLADSDFANFLGGIRMSFFFHSKNRNNPMQMI